MKRLFLTVLIFFITAPCFAQARFQLEKTYQKTWCDSHNGTMEVVLSDRARVDCVTAEYAVEFDFANKWAEAIGQSLYYGKSLNKKAGIVLIMEDEIKDQKYLDRVNSLAKQHNIKVWTVTPFCKIALKNNRNI